jgi:hypothetical protein
VQSVKNAILLLAGSTKSNTTIQGVIWEGDEPDYDAEAQMYISIIMFTIETSNR